MKLAQYIPIRKTIDIVELIDIFIYYIFKDFSYPKGITSNREIVFISKF